MRFARRTAIALFLLLGSAQALAGDAWLKASRTTYVADPKPISGETTRVIASGKVMATFTIAPQKTIELTGTVDRAAAKKIRASDLLPLVPGRVLYGWEDRPGLYCDLYRTRGLGMAAACLFDRDLDGQFETGIHYGFESGMADIILLAERGDFEGAILRDVVPLAAPVGYKPSQAAFPGAKINLYFQFEYRKNAFGVQAPHVRIFAANGNRYASTQALAEKYLSVNAADLPKKVDYYGFEIELVRLKLYNGNGFLTYKIRNTGTKPEMKFVFRRVVTCYWPNCPRD